MSIASHADILCGPRALPGGAATSRLEADRAERMKSAMAARPNEGGGNKPWSK